jgi:16S rRNA (cytidine1402-2'-O)-methyltransferase
MVIYESPYRLVKLLEELMQVLGEGRQVSVSREISKLHAETVRGTVKEVYDHFAAKEVKGEIVVIVSAEDDASQQENTETEQ